MHFIGFIILFFLFLVIINPAPRYDAEDDGIGWGCLITILIGTMFAFPWVWIGVIWAGVGLFKEAAIEIGDPQYILWALFALYIAYAIWFNYKERRNK